ncbi:AI-2E family transporter YdiK, partial [Stenotrophomonas maltophilia]|nr:AI-2E family transporter YdiK [Stenotrophomonas maltophilia]
MQFLLTTLIAAVMYAYGELAAAKALAFGRRMAGERGEMAVLQAGQAVRGVALGVVVTALAQSILGGVGLL